MNYWFRPKKFWKMFAFYYPSSVAGWVCTLVLLFFLVADFWAADAKSHSVSDTLIGFAPIFIAIAIFFDFLCFRFGEYPSWWRKRKDRD